MHSSIIHIVNGVFLKNYKKKKNHLKVFILFKTKIYCILFKKNLFLLQGSNYSCLITPFLKVHKENNFYLFTSLLKGFLKNWSLGIKLIGVGYRFVKVKKRSFSIKIGLSHLLKYYVNYEIRLLRTTKRNSKIIFFSTNKEALCSLISTLRLIRVPDNYKGKGFQLLNEIVYIKKREKFGVF